MVRGEELVTDLLIVPRTPENAYMDFEGHGYYENFYKGIAQNFETVVLSTEVTEKKTYKLGEKSRLSFTPYKTGNKILEAVSLVKNIFWERPDTVMTENASLTTITAFLTGKIVGSQTVMKIEALPREEDQIWISCLLADKVSSVAECVDNSLPVESTVVHPGTDFPENITAQEFDEDKVHVGFLGRFHRDKGVDRFIHLVENFEDSDDIVFHLAGRGDFMVEKMKKLDDSRSDFNYHGKLESKRVFPFLKGLDTLVVPSRIEGCTRVVVESLYSRTSVLAWDIEPHREMIEDEDLLVNSIEEIKDKIDRRVFETDLSWFNPENYTVENEIKGMTDVINK